MPKKFIKRWFPHHHAVHYHRSMRFLGPLIHEPDLWHLNRHSVAGAFAVGLFCAFIPLPLQMMLAGATAVALRVNLPISVSLVWITNPLTFAPIFFFNYQLGTLILGRPIQIHQFRLSLDWLISELNTLWAPLLVGSLVVATVSAVLGYLFVRILWRILVIYQWTYRRRKRIVRKPIPETNEQNYSG
jgi:uncharacterized protein (DUF2062 family)